MPGLAKLIFGKLLSGLTGPIGWIAQFVLDYVFKKLWAWITNAIRTWLRRKQIDKESKQSVEPLKKAQTAEEIDRATDDALDGF